MRADRGMWWCWCWLMWRQRIIENFSLTLPFGDFFSWGTFDFNFLNYGLLVIRLVTKKPLGVGSGLGFLLLLPNKNMRLGPCTTHPVLFLWYSVRHRGMGPVQEQSVWDKIRLFNRSSRALLGANNHIILYQRDRPINMVRNAYISIAY